MFQFLNLINLKTWLYIGVAGIVVGCFFYISHLKNEVSLYKENQSKLEFAIEQQVQALEIKNQEIEQIKVIHSQLQVIREEQQEKIVQLENKFRVKTNGKARDFGELSRAKPGLVNKLVNSSTEKVNRCLELATGSTPKQGEMNNECQEIIDKYNNTSNSRNK